MKDFSLWAALKRLRRILFGAPIHSSQAHHERLSPLLGLPVFASDALSSVAYATEAILSVLVLYGLAAIHDQLPIAAAVAALIVIVTISYSQTIRAYPHGGGSYIVASDNFGETVGLIAGGALLIDYVLTVAVSVSAGVAAIVSAYPSLHNLLVPMSLLFIGGVAWANLRGVRESGAAFALPTYGFILAMGTMLVTGVVQSLGTAPPPQVVFADPNMLGSAASLPFLFVILRSFAAGCTALTGIEAVSDGVAAFRDPAPQNAIRTLRIMAFLLVGLFIGTGYLSRFLPEITLHSTANPEYRTLVSQLAIHVFGADSALFYVLQFATAAILVLAANTAFADFPRLGSFLARDGFLPRAMARQGDRLVFQNGIILLAVLAGTLVWHFHGNLDHLLPLYAVGVFTAFTLSQLGMLRYWSRRRSTDPKWMRGALVSGTGGIVTALVTLVILVTKFMEGAWIVVILLAVLFVSLRAVKQRYESIARQLETTKPAELGARKNLVLVLVPRVHRGVQEALDYALSCHGECRAIHVTLDEKNVPTLRDDWERLGRGVPLVVLGSPFRSLIKPILEYVDEARDEDPNRMVTVIVSEAVPRKWIHKLLQENVAIQLKLALGQREGIAVTNLRYFLD
ncbi:MAG: APC family permease [Fimbriimonadaceae bacterium]|nr:APC family permease [Chthonomonadaceae bacterium]MCO5295308.1 APC family permease [Fimbriimonadaceae bacterium]